MLLCRNFISLFLPSSLPAVSPLCEASLVFFHLHFRQHILHQFFRLSSATSKTGFLSTTRKHEQFVPWANSSPLQSASFWKQTTACAHLPSSSHLPSFDPSVLLVLWKWFFTRSPEGPLSVTLVFIHWHRKRVLAAHWACAGCKKQLIFLWKTSLFSERGRSGWRGSSYWSVRNGKYEKRCPVQCLAYRVQTRETMAVLSTRFQSN